MNAAFEIDGLETLSRDEMVEVNGGFNFASLFTNLFAKLPTLISDGKSLIGAATTFWTDLRGLFN